ncbi:MAG: HlyD family efflux transporter periplasmic adaptor subunit, partial [Proteobacteria bacterium]|nr:HlyD family efflux transporter periplasmic adaptor subunit [Pseudomonadota bacterium]
SEKKTNLTFDLEKLRAKAGKLSQGRISTQAELNKTTQEQATKKIVLERTGKELSKSYASIEASQAQQKILSELIYSFGGTHAGVITVLEFKDKIEGIQGTVADRFKPAAGMEKAVESALGDISHYVICDSKDTAEKIIERLKIENKGRAGLIVPNAGSLNPQIKRPQLSSAGFVGWLDEFVSTAENLKPLMQTVLSQTAVFEAGSDPKAILEHLPYGFKAVSTDGLLYTRNTIVGGSSEALQLFSRKDQLTELSEQINQFKAEVDLTRQQLANIRLIAPFDGVIIEGDLSQLLGSPVERGDTLFKIAPLAGYRIILKVDESDISYIDQGQTGTLVLSSLSERSLPLTVEKITTVAKADDGANIFRVEAKLNNAPDLLRPGMEGVGKVNAGRARMIWIWTHEITDWLQLWIWSWWP